MQTLLQSTCKGPAQKLHCITPQHPSWNGILGCVLPMQIGTSSEPGGISLQLFKLNTWLTHLSITFFFSDAFLSFRHNSLMAQSKMRSSLNTVSLQTWMFSHSHPSTYFPISVCHLKALSSLPGEMRKGFKFSLKTSLVYNYLNQYLWGTHTVVGTGNIIKTQTYNWRSFITINLHIYI